MVKKVYKNYSSYDKGTVSYLYMVEHGKTEDQELIKKINQVFDEYNVRWDWENAIDRIPTVIGSDGEVYFTSDDRKVCFYGKDMYGNLSTYNGKLSADCIYNTTNSLETLLKNKCEKTYGFYNNINYLMNNVVYIEGVRETVNIYNDVVIRKAYLNTADEHKLDLIKTIEELSGFYFFEDIAGDSIKPEDLDYVSICGEDYSKVKFYFRLIKGLDK